jgi:cellobiose transport system permease protein
VALYILMGYMPGREGGWNGHIIAVIVPSLVSAFGVFYMRQFILGAIPDELVESARVDGASTMRIYWSIVLPAIKAALAVLGLLTFVATWNDFQWPLITLGGTDMPTSMVALSDLASGNYVLYRRVLSGAFLATLPLIILLFIGGRQIVRGIMEGAVKS